MRIMHILNHLGRLNGNVHAAVDLACAQAELGHDVAVCSRGGTFDPLLASRGVALFNVELNRRPATLVKATWQFGRACAAFRPDVVHAHMMTSCALAWPVTRLRRTPLVATVHNAFEPSAALMGLGDRVIAVSDVVKASMAERGIPAGKLRMVLNGTIGSARFSLPQPPGATLEHPAIVTVCGMHPRKGVADLIDAFAIVARNRPDARLYLVGEGPMRAEYEARANELGLADKVCFAGGVEDPRPYLASADVFVLASHSDPAPLVLSEAREAGCAIVGTDVDGIPQLLDHGAAGIVVPPKRPDAIAEAVLGLLNSPESLRDHRDRSGRNLQSFSVARVAAQTLEVYEECLRAPRPRSSAATDSPRPVARDR